METHINDHQKKTTEFRLHSGHWIFVRTYHYHFCSGTSLQTYSSSTLFDLSRTFFRLSSSPINDNNSSANSPSVLSDKRLHSDYIIASSEVVGRVVSSPDKSPVGITAFPGSRVWHVSKTSPPPQTPPPIPIPPSTPPPTPAYTVPFSWCFYRNSEGGTDFDVCSRFPFSEKAIWVRAPISLF